jgi:hypothetical protein
MKNLQQLHPDIYDFAEGCRQIARKIRNKEAEVAPQCALVSYTNDKNQRLVEFIQETNEFFSTEEGKNAFPVFVQLKAADFRREQKAEIEALVLISDVFISHYEGKENVVEGLKPADDPFRKEAILISVYTKDETYLLHDKYTRANGTIQWGETGTYEPQEGKFDGRFADLFPHKGVLAASPESFRFALKRHPFFKQILDLAPKGVDVDATLMRVFNQLVASTN